MFCRDPLLDSIINYTIIPFRKHIFICVGKINFAGNDKTSTVVCTPKIRALRNYGEDYCKKNEMSIFNYKQM